MKNSEQPAFPAPDTIHPSTGERFEPLCSGLTKREYFAGLAMQGLLAYKIRGGLAKTAAKDAVQIADALLAELQNKK